MLIGRSTPGNAACKGYAACALTETIGRAAYLCAAKCPSAVRGSAQRPCRMTGNSTLCELRSCPPADSKPLVTDGLVSAGSEAPPVSSARKMPAAKHLSKNIPWRFESSCACGDHVTILLICYLKVDSFLSAQGGETPSLHEHIRSPRLGHLHPRQTPWPKEASDHANCI